jgi:predicted metalloprotease with PDZ domain
MRPFRWAVACRLALLAGVFLGTTPARATIRYAVSLGQPDQHIFRVSMTIPAVRNQVTVQIPAWNALYQIRDFAARISSLRAMDEASQPLPVSKLDKQTWLITGQGAITVEYSTFWDEPGPFGAQLNPSHAFLNLALVLLYVSDRREEDVRIEFDDLPVGWRAAAALRPADTTSGRRAVAYLAPSYDALVDAPVELGTFDEFRLDAIRPPVRIVVHAENSLSKTTREQVTAMVHRVVTYEVALMGGAPYEEYVFLYHIGPGYSGGGMEHANSTAISMESATNLAGVTAHEFFHLWNVKRIRPASLEPVDYAREQWTRALWFAEGVTSTYGAYTLLRSGLWTRKQFYEDLAAQITELESRPARRWKSVEEASIDAWLEKYSFYRRPDFSISYYNKGQLLGVLLDTLIRDSTDNRTSLDDVMRALNDEFGRRGRPYDDSVGIRAMAERISGRSLADFFSRYVSGTDELPFADLLGRAGLVLKVSGGTRAELGFWPGRGPEGMVATQIAPGSPAALAGVREGDVLPELNGASFPRNPERWLRDHRPGETVRLRIRRNGEEKDLNFILQERQERAYVIEEVPNPSEKQRRILNGLLQGATDVPQP